MVKEATKGKIRGLPPPTLQDLSNKVDRILQLLEELVQACFEDPDSDADSSVADPLSDGVE